MSKLDIEDAKTIKLKFWYGNHHELIKAKETMKANKHKWAVYFKCGDKSIDETKLI